MVRITTTAMAVEAELGDVEHRIQNAGPANEVTGQALRNAILRNFRRGGFFPSRWRRSRRAKQFGGKTLADTATLRNSMHAAHGDTWAAAGTDVVYAGIHQYGGECGRNHATNMPARPFLPIDEAGRLEPGLGRRIGRIHAAWILEGRV